MGNAATSGVEGIEQHIRVVRGQSVLLDVELAELYGVRPSALIQAVRRNQSRFPKDFMFQLANQELANLKSQSVISSLRKGHGGRGVFLKSWLGRDVYTIGCTTYEGEDGWKGLGNTPIPAASEASIEGQLKKLGHAYAFLDLQRAGGPMRHPQVMRVPKFDEVSVADPTQPYDGLLFIARMERGKQIGIGQG